MFSKGLGTSKSPIIIESEVEDSPIKVIQGDKFRWAVTTFVFENFSSMKSLPFPGPQRMLNQLVVAIAIQSDLLLKVFSGLKVSHFKVSHIATVRLKYSRDVFVQ